ncbi:MAG: hypothetical protein CL967_05705 [Euryarchaeota archaeon]|nr:hypothetical protein [Euryarchaeota archaeon]
MSLLRRGTPVARARIVSETAPLRADVERVVLDDSRKSCCEACTDAYFGDPDRIGSVSLTYGDRFADEGGIDPPECLCNCCGTKRSLVLICNAAAAVLHAVLFVSLLVIVIAWDIDLTRPLISRVTIWEKIDADQPQDVCFHSAKCAIPSPKISLNTTNGEFSIYARQVDYGSLSLQWLVLSFSFLSATFQGLRPLVNSAERNLRPCLARVFCGCCYESNNTERLRTPPSEMEVRSSYLRDVMLGVNSTRFVEYAFSATTMILAIAFTLNVEEFVVYVMLATSTAATQLMGLVAELLLEKNKAYRKELFPAAWILHSTGWLLQIGVFWTIVLSFQLSASEAESMRGVEPPAFVYVIVWSMLALFGSFGVVQLVDFCHRTCYDVAPLADAVGDKDFKCCRNTWWCTQRRCFGCPSREANELAFIVLSLSAKALLSLLVASNLFMAP